MTLPIARNSNQVSFVSLIANLSVDPTSTATLAPGYRFGAYSGDTYLHLTDGEDTNWVNVTTLAASISTQKWLRNPDAVANVMATLRGLGWATQQTLSGGQIVESIQTSSLLGGWMNLETDVRNVLGTRAQFTIAPPYDISKIHDNDTLTLNRLSTSTGQMESIVFEFQMTSGFVPTGGTFLVIDGTGWSTGNDADVALITVFESIGYISLGSDSVHGPTARTYAAALRGSFGNSAPPQLSNSTDWYLGSSYGGSDGISALGDPSIFAPIVQLAQLYAYHDLLLGLTRCYHHVYHYTEFQGSPSSSTITLPALPSAYQQFQVIQAKAIIKTPFHTSVSILTSGTPTAYLQASSGTKGTLVNAFDCTQAAGKTAGDGLGAPSSVPVGGVELELDMISGSVPALGDLDAGDVEFNILLL